MNFITIHIINKIGETIQEKQKYLNHTEFLYLDNPTNSKNRNINRVNKFNYYYQDEILPQSFYFLEGQKLIEIFDSLRRNNFFIYRNIEGKDFKLRIKNID